MLVVAYYTVNTPYADEAKRMRRSVEALGMPLQLVSELPFDDWYAATLYKAAFLRRRREVHAGPLLYVDVDAYLHRDVTNDLEPLASDYDLAVHFHRDTELLSGTIWINDTSAALDCLRRWEAINQQVLESCGRVWDQRTLGQVVEQTPGLRIKRLPARYTYITDLSRRHYPDEPCWIEHLQASREFHRKRETQLLRNRRRRVAELERS